jgi:predicted PurR-regulated permease PerM
MTRLRIPRVLAITLLISIIIVAMVLLVAYLGTSLNELARTFAEVPLFACDSLQTTASA